MTETVRKNQFCIICKTPNENGWYDILTNSAWSANPYPDTYTEVQDEMVEDAKATGGYLIPTFNEDGTKMIDFEPTKKPQLPELEREPTEEELQWQAITDLEIEQMEYWQALTDLEIEVLGNE